MDEQLHFGQDKNGRSLWHSNRDGTLWNGWHYNGIDPMELIAEMESTLADLRAHYCPPQPPSASGEREAALIRLMPEVLGSLRADGMNVSLVADVERAIAAPSPGIDATERKPLSDDFRNGIRAAADCLMYTAANSDDGQWAGILNTYAADILELSPEDANEWKAIGTAYTEGFKAGQRAAPPAAQPSADDKNFPFYELRFIMRVLSHQGSAPKEDWQTAYGMARDIFVRWSKKRQAAEPHPPSRACMCDACKPSFENGADDPAQRYDIARQVPGPSAEWIAEAERLVDAHGIANENIIDGDGAVIGIAEDARAALLAHLKART